MTNENWMKEETLKLLKNRANSEVEKHKKQESDLKKQGYRKVLINHPSEPRCKIERWVK